MKLIKPSFEIWEQEPGIQGIYKAIEKAARVCYKSESKTTENSAKPFVDRLIKSGHLAMLEHGTVYLEVPYNYYNQPDEVEEMEEFYLQNPYSKIIEDYDLDGGYPAQGPYGACLCITTNMRVIVEHNRKKDLKYLCEPTQLHEERVCVHFTSDIGTLREFLRHRVINPAQESTRFCNYFKDKFGNSVSVIYPLWLKEEEELAFEEDMTVIEQIYFKWLKKGWSAQQARVFLPLGTKSEAVMTGFTSGWEHFFKLRCSFLAETGKPHPQASELADPLYREFVARGLINDLETK